MEPFQKVRFLRPEKHDASLRLRPVFQDFHLMKVFRNHEYPEHVHGDYELILVKAGPYLCRLNGAELRLAAGDVLVIQPGDVHQDHLRRGQRHYVLHFRVEFGVKGDDRSRLFKAGLDPEHQVSRGAHSRDVALLKEIGAEALRGEAHSGIIQDRLLEVLFWRTMRNLPAAGLTTLVRRLPKDECMRERIRSLFVAHVEQHVSTGELAAKLGLSPRHLTNTCRALFGLPPAKLLLSLKIDRAEDLMRDHQLRVKEVSDRLGFLDPYHFSRAFKRLRGFPPSNAASRLMENAE